MKPKNSNFLSKEEFRKLGCFYFTLLWYNIKSGLMVKAISKHEDFKCVCLKLFSYLKQNDTTLQCFVKNFDFIREHFVSGNDSVNIFCESGSVIDHRNSLLMIQLILCHFNSLNLVWMPFWSICHSVIKIYGFGVGMIRWNCRIWAIQKVRLDNHNCSPWPHRLFILCIRPSAFDFKYAWLP